MHRGRILQVISLGIVAVLVLGTRMTYALLGSAPKTGIRLKIKKEWKGSYSGYPKAARLAIYNAEEWKGIWEKVNALRLPKPELPKINFEKEMVIAVFMGERHSGGYSIEITSILKTEKEIVAAVEEKEPSPESLRTLALTSPYHIVVIKKYPLAVNFQSPQNSQEE